MKITVNPDKEIVAIAKQRLKELNGQCPCVLPPFHSDKTKCMCANFRDKIHNGYEGYCDCMYYYVTQKENEL